MTRTVIAASGAWVRVPGSVLNPVQRHARLERERHERVAQTVRRERLRDPSRTREPPHDTRGIMTVEATTLVVDQQGAGLSSAALRLDSGHRTRRQRDD